ncbi:MAG: TonB family protein, partial [Betaproteobacteria bacterium]
PVPPLPPEPEPSAAQTVLLRPPPATEALPLPAAAPPPEPEPALAQTVLLRPPLGADDSGAAATVLMAPSVTAQLPSDAATAQLPSDAATVQQAAAPTEALAASRPGRPGLPLAWVLAGAAALLVVAAGVVGLMLWRGGAQAAATVVPPAPGAASGSPPPAPATPPPTAAPASGALHLESDPPGAGVRVNGQARGQTPLDLRELPLGDYEVVFERRGYEAQARRVSLSAAAPLAELRAKLVRSAPTTGTAEIVSSPAGAEVTIDGKPLGRTPLARVTLAAGSRSLRLTLDGHLPWSGKLDVVAGQRGRVEVRLKPVAAPPPPAATPAPEVVDTARVYQESEVDVRARKLSGSSPSYPSDRAPRLRSGERVSVLLQFVVSETGEVQDVKVLESGGKAVDDVVVSAVRRWRYAPATRKGTKVKSLTAFKQTFLGG